jgi:hypothetical protein
MESDTETKLAKPQSSQLEPREALIEAIGFPDPVLGGQLVDQLWATLWIPTDESREKQLEKLTAAVIAMRSIKPEDGVESLLAAQMIATHSAAMEWKRRAARPEHSLEGADFCLRQAAKLLALFLKQVDTLNRKRRGGQQKVTVEHVQVESGGQAIVGHVEQKSTK